MKHYLIVFKSVSNTFMNKKIFLVAICFLLGDYSINAQTGNNNTVPVSSSVDSVEMKITHLPVSCVIDRAAGM